MLANAKVGKHFEMLKSQKPTSRQNWIAKVKSYYQKLNSSELQKLAEIIRDTHIETKVQRDQNHTKREIHNTAVDLLAYKF